MPLVPKSGQTINAQVLRDETTPKANTKSRVYSLFKDVIDSYVHSNDNVFWKTSGTTILNGVDSTNLIIQRDEDQESAAIVFPNPDSGWNGGNEILLISGNRDFDSDYASLSIAKFDNNFSSASLYATNGVNTQGYIGVDNTGFLELNTYSGSTYSYSLTFGSQGALFNSPYGGGLKYGSDYSSSFTERSLVDKAYVDNVAGGGGGGSGWALSGTTNLIGASTINSNYTLTFASPNLNLSSPLIFGTSTGDGLIEFASNDGFNTSSVQLRPASLILIAGMNGGLHQITMSPTQFNISSSHASFIGAAYNDDYSSKFTKRSLVDKAFVTGITSSISPSYLSYVAIISQVGTNDPTVTILQNTLGDTITWSRTGVGSYKGTKGTPFTHQNIYVMIGQPYGAGIGASARVSNFSGQNHVSVITFSHATGSADDVLFSQTIEIRVYP